MNTDPNSKPAANSVVIGVGLGAVVELPALMAAIVSGGASNSLFVWQSRERKLARIHGFSRWTSKKWAMKNAENPCFNPRIRENRQLWLEETRPQMTAWRTSLRSCGASAGKPRGLLSEGCAP